MIRPVQQESKSHATYSSCSLPASSCISCLYALKTFCSLPPKYVCTWPGRRAFSDMYVCREYSFRGNRQSQTNPMSMHNAERYGGNLRSRGSRRRASIVGASMVISTPEIFRKTILQLHELLTDQCHPKLCCTWWAHQLRIEDKRQGIWLLCKQTLSLPIQHLSSSELVIISFTFVAD